MYLVQRLPSTWGQFVKPVTPFLQPLLTLLGALLQPGEVIELRVSDWSDLQHPPRLIANGYFGDPLALAEAALRYEGQAVILEFAVNPVRHDLLLTAYNEVRRPAVPISKPSDVTRRAVLPLKFQLAPSVVTKDRDEAYLMARRRADQCEIFLTKRFGWPEPAVVDSFLWGAELLYRIDLPNTAASTKLLEQVFEVLDQRFSDDRVVLNANTVNPVHLCQVFGLDMHPQAVPEVIETEVVYQPEMLLAVNPELLHITAGGEPPIASEQTAETEAVNQFVETACTLEPQAWTQIGELYNVYQAFCQKQGLKPLPMPSFTRKLVIDWRMQPGPRKVQGMAKRGLWGIRPR